VAEIEVCAAISVAVLSESVSMLAMLSLIAIVDNVEAVPASIDSSDVVTIVVNEDVAVVTAVLVVDIIA
jgi:hypothetical protein